MAFLYHNEGQKKDNCPTEGLCYCGEHVTIHMIDVVVIGDVKQKRLAHIDCAYGHKLERMFDI